MLATLFGASAADIISDTRRVTWSPGNTVGLLQPPPAWTTTVNVHTVYGADKTGITNAATAINQAITEYGNSFSGTGAVIYLPAGSYRTESRLYIEKDNIRLLGDGQGQTMVNRVGSEGAALVIGGSGVSTTFSIHSGATRGSTNLALVGDLSAISAGDIVSVQSVPGFSSEIHVLVTPTGIGTLSLDNWVQSRNGTNLVLGLPLPCDMTNSPTLVQRSQNSQGGLRASSNVWVEGITFTHANPPTAEVGTSPDMFSIQTARNFVLTNCEMRYIGQHVGLITTTVGGYISRCVFRDGGGSGSGIGGIRQEGTALLIENNAFVNLSGGTGIESDGGWGWAVYGNHFTNTGYSFNFHGSSHQMFVLVEQNKMHDVMFDNYFASASHCTFFRNWMHGNGYIGFRVNRFSRQMNVVGNVIGSNTTYNAASWQRLMNSTNQTPPALYSFGLPNFNQSYSGQLVTNAAWNYPGTYFFDNNGGGLTAYTPYVFTNSQGPTNVLWGNFAATGIVPYSSVLTLLFQSSADTNSYYTGASGAIVYPIEITTSNMTVNTPVTVTNGARMFVSGPPSYQQIHEADFATHLITGNYEYGTDAQVWDASGVQTLTTSYLYPGGAPRWWDTGTYRSPVVQPDSGTLVTRLPAEDWRDWQTASEGGGESTPSRSRAGGRFKITGQFRMK